jgi:hypothetical protein
VIALHAKPPDFRMPDNIDPEAKADFFRLTLEASKKGRPRYRSFEHLIGRDKNSRPIRYHDDGDIGILW